jgi:hypothetical protein
VVPLGQRRCPARPRAGSGPARGQSANEARAAALFRIWHGVRELIEEAERLGDNEMVHFLSVTQLLVEEKITALTSGTTAFDAVDTSLPH